MEREGRLIVAHLAVLLMSYGTPRNLDEVEAYLTDIRGGKAPTPVEVATLRDRYRAIGGRSPLPEICRAQAHELQRSLDSAGADAEVFVGMRHWHPYIRDVVPEIAGRGFDHLLGIVLTPHFSRMSVGAYEKAVRAALDAAPRCPGFSMVHQWHLHSSFVSGWADAIAAVRTARPAFAASDARILFSAHSLPSRILDEGDPYADQLDESCRAIADRLGGPPWAFAWQSQGSHGSWLGPPLTDRLAELQRDGVRAVLSAPIGFTADHLEILYDLDVVARERAVELGMLWSRAPSLNAGPALIVTLAGLVQDALHKGPGTPSLSGQRALPPGTGGRPRG